MARRGAPALYELLRKSHLANTASGKSGATAPTGADAAPQAAPKPQSAPTASLHRGLRSTPTPGQPVMFQVSLLWVVVAVAAIVVIVVIAYNVGTRNNGTATNSTAGAPAPAPAPRTPTPSPNNSGSPRIPTVTPPPLAATDNNGDPRVKGFKYFVLAHPSTLRAPELVEFCRANGLDAYLVPDDNAMLTKVIVLPGYRDSSEKSSDPIRTLEANIKSIGEKWKRAKSGNKDFSDAYPEMYR